MEQIEELLYRLRRVEGVVATEHVPLRHHARFGLGGPARLLVESGHPEPFLEALDLARPAGLPWIVLGGGSNLIVADEGYPGIALRFLGARIQLARGAVLAESGAELQALVDFTIGHGLSGLHTMTRIPGWVSGAVYGNAGAYGHSIVESISRVQYCDAQGARWIDAAACRFDYRESVFKNQKDWTILAVELRMPPADPAAMRKQAEEIRAIRDAKYPPAMRCAGSIFKNCILARIPPAAAAQVPESGVREGKVASAWFLEQVGAKGMRRGDIQVAHHHANLIYNDGEGRASDVRAVIAELKKRVLDRFGLELEEEVQYVGF